MDKNPQIKENTGELENFSRNGQLRKNHCQCIQFLIGLKMNKNVHRKFKVRFIHRRIQQVSKSRNDKSTKDTWTQKLKTTRRIYLDLLIRGGRKKKRPPVTGDNRRREKYLYAVLFHSSPEMQNEPKKNARHKEYGNSR